MKKNSIQVSTFAGSIPGFRNGPLLEAQFNNSYGIVCDLENTLYVSEFDTNCIRQIKDGMVSVFAGIPKEDGLVNGPLRQAKFHCPTMMKFDASFTNLYVSEYGNNSIRRISMKE